MKFLGRAIVLYPKAVWMADQMRADQVAHIHPAMVAWVINKLVGISYSVTIHAHDIFVNRSMLHKKMYDAGFIVTIPHSIVNF